MYLGEVGDDGGQRHELLLHLLAALALGDDVLLRVPVRPAPPLRHLWLHRRSFNAVRRPVTSREVERATMRLPAEGEDAGRRRRLPWLALDRQSSERHAGQCWDPEARETTRGLVCRIRRMHRVRRRHWWRRRRVVLLVLGEMLRRHPGVLFLLPVHVC